MEDSTHELKPAFYDIVGAKLEECYISQSDLEEWREYQARRYPSKLNLDRVEEAINLAIDLEEERILKEKIGEWKSKQTDWNESNLRQLAYYEGQIDNLHGVIFANEEIFKLVKTDWDQASQLQRLSELYLKLGKPELAWEKIDASRTYLKNISNWKQMGLGRFIIENAFEVVISLSDPENEISQKSYFWALVEVIDMENLHLKLFQKIKDAAHIMGDQKTEEKFSATYEQEKSTR